MDIKAKLIGNEDERAVSPVIGVILMVAITVILAAVIAAFVLDLGGSIGEEAQAGVNIDVDQPGDEFLVTWTTQGNADSIEATVEYDVENDEGDSAEGLLDSDDIVDQNVGSTLSWTASDLIDEIEDEGDFDGGADDTEAANPYQVSGTITVTATIEGGSTTVVATDSFEFEDVEYDS